MKHSSFVTTTRGLNRDLPPMRLYERAKKLGVWNPSEIEFSRDRQDWQTLTDEEKDLVWRLLGMFVSGEEAVTLDLLPLIHVIAAEGRLEEEMYLTTFLFEEAKHTDFFRRFLDEVTGTVPDLERYHGENYRYIFYEALPAAMLALREDASPKAQVRASVTYNMIVEGVLAETGYHAFLTALQRRNLLPGLCQGISLLKRDESRHIAYGVYLISRLLSVTPDLWDEVQAQMSYLLPYAIGVITDAFAAYEVVPFGLVEDDFVQFAIAQFTKRSERLEKARSSGLEAIDRLTHAVIDEEM
ncbi:MAG: R2-like ligand-binding oxidase [Anaerolineales bacterium]